MAGAVTRPKAVVWSGPLAEFGPGFVEELRRLGFTPLAAVHQARLAAHLSRWMQPRGLDVAELTWDRLDEFLVERRVTHSNRYSRKALLPLVGFLDRLGVLPADEARAPSPNEVAVADFERYLIAELGDRHHRLDALAVGDLLVDLTERTRAVHETCAVHGRHELVASDQPERVGVAGVVGEWRLVGQAEQIGTGPPPRDRRRAVQLTRVCR